MEVQLGSTYAGFLKTWEVCNGVFEVVKKLLRYGSHCDEGVCIVALRKREAVLKVVTVMVNVVNNIEPEGNDTSTT